MRSTLNNYNVRKIRFRKFLRQRKPDQKVNSLHGYFRDGIINDRHEILRKIKGKFNNVELNIEANYFHNTVKQYVRFSDEDHSEHKINEDEGFGQPDKINGDSSYDIAVTIPLLN